MPSSTLVVACVVGLALLVVLLLVVRSRNKPADVAAPRFEPPRELAKRPAKEPAKDATPVSTASPTKAREARESAPPPSTPEPAKQESTQKLVIPPEALAPSPIEEEEVEKTTLDVIPPSSEEIAPEQILDAHSVKQKTAAAAPPPPLPRSEPKAARPRMPSYSDISDESVAEEAPKAPEVAPAKLPVSEPKVAAAPRLPVSEPKLPISQPKLPVSQSRVAAARPLPTSEPKVPAARPQPKLPVSEPKLPVSEPKLPVSEPKLPVSEPRVAAKPVEAPVTPAKPEDHDFSALNEAPRAKATTTAAATAAKFAPPPNPATADLEKNDPRHAAARRLARVSVSEIKLYHEDEVKAGREAKDLWKRLSQDIALAKQTFEARVVNDVRDRFDYLLDEIIRQLAEGDASKLGPDAPKMKGEAAAEPAAAGAGAGAVTAPPPPMEPAESPTGEASPAATEELEAPTQTAGRTLPEPTPAVVAAEPKPAEAKPAADGKPSGVAARGLPANPETAELEKSDPRHAAARRLARLSVSEIKLYHEDEVKAGRAANDIWKRMITDIGLAMQTYEKRVDKEVRERFDYLYDEILRQLAEGDVAKLGRDAPKPKTSGEAAPVAAPVTLKASEPKLAAAPASAPKFEPKPSEPKLAAAPNPAESDRKLAAAPPAAVAAAPAPAPAPAPGGAAARYLPPANPATADLEKNDPRHAAARRLARLSVSEIKLYHEDEVKAGREAKDLWKRLITDIGLATQTYEKRVDKEVRERFDYLYDEILRQLAEGDAAKLGADAPRPKADA